jgi:hypothetical protein
MPRIALFRNGLPFFGGQNGDKLLNKSSLGALRPAAKMID